MRTQLSIVANTGDDLWRYGLRICPDLDTNLYALSGLRDTERGWGVAGDSFRTMEQLRVLGDDAWFNLGDLDLATHLLRTGMLRDGLRALRGHGAPHRDPGSWAWSSCRAPTMRCRRECTLRAVSSRSRSTSCSAGPRTR